MNNTFKKNIFQNLGFIMQLFRRTKQFPKAFLSLSNVVKANNYQLVYFDYKRMHDLISSEIAEEFSRIMSFRIEEDIERYLYLFEKAYQEYLKGGRCIATSSCTAAITFALRLSGVKEGDEVIVPVNTYVATALAVCDVGARPIFVDVDETGLINCNLLEHARTVNTKAIIPVHLYGFPCNLDAIMAFAKKYSLYVIEDAAQAHGTLFRGEKVGTFGDFGCFSLHSSKLLGGLGNGGMLVVKNSAKAVHLAALQNPYLNSSMTLKSKRTPDQLNPFNAALSWVKLKHLEEYIQRRIQIADTYTCFLSDIQELDLSPRTEKYNRATYRSYVVQTKERDALKIYLFQKGIETKVFYQEPLHLMKTFEFLGYKKGDFPVAEMRAKKMLSLPTGPYLLDDEVRAVAKVIRYFYDKRIKR